MPYLCLVVLGAYLKKNLQDFVPVSAAPSSASPPSGQGRYYGRMLLGSASRFQKRCQHDLHNYRNTEEWRVAVFSAPLLNACCSPAPVYTHNTSGFNRAIIIHFVCGDTRRHVTWVYLTDVLLDCILKNRTYLNIFATQHFIHILTFFFLANYFLLQFKQTQYINSIILNAVAFDRVKIVCKNSVLIH